MKKLLLFTSIVLYTINTYAQIYTTVQTCKGSTIDALLYNDISQQTKDQIKSQFLINYGTIYNITSSDILEDATPTYNCHSYAWHLREGNTNKVWINNTDGSQSGGCYINNNNINKYWTDGCFIQVCNEADANKIHYYCGDHSAVNSTIVTGKFESKWGQLPVVRHLPANVPYIQPTSVNYYASTKILGDISNLCSGNNRIFSVKNIAGATYTWSNSNNLSVTGMANTSQLSVQQNGNANGLAWVEVQISTPCSAAPVINRVNFTVGFITPSSNSQIYFDYGVAVNPFFPCEAGFEGRGNFAYRDDLSTSDYGFQYEVDNNDPNFYFDTNNNGIFHEYWINSNFSGTLHVPVRVKNSCGWSSEYFILDVEVTNCNNGYRYVYSPNPANDYLNIMREDVSANRLEISRNSSLAKEKAPSTIKFSAFIFNDKGKVIAQGYNINNRINIDIRNIPNGNYFLHITEEKETVIKQIIIKH